MKSFIILKMDPAIQNTLIQHTPCVRLNTLIKRSMTYVCIEEIQQAFIPIPIAM